MTDQQPPLEAPVDLEPWDRQPGETDPAWTAFVDYRDAGAGQRSQHKTARSLSCSRQTLAGWSTRHEWRKRVEAWDREQDRAKRRATIETVEKVAKRQATSLDAAAAALVMPIQAYLQRIQMKRQQVGDGELWSDYTDKQLAAEAQTAARLIPQLIQAERLVHGLSTSGAGQIVADEGSDERARVGSLARVELEGMLVGS